MNEQHLTSEALGGLAIAMPPDGRLVFGDDSEVGEAKGMLPDVQLLVAVDMTPAAYTAAQSRLRAYLTGDLPGEFDATDIVAGRNGTPWARVTPERRLGSFRELSQTLVATGANLTFLHIPESQYGDMRRRLAAEGVDLKLGWKAAMRRVFLRLLMDEANVSGRSTLIVTDQHRPAPTPATDRSEDAPGLAGGGVFTAPSDQVIGLQLADMAAFCMRRHLRRRAGYDPETLRGFDKVVVETMAGFEGRSRSLLNGMEEGA